MSEVPLYFAEGKSSSLLVFLRLQGVFRVSSFLFMIEVEGLGLGFRAVALTEIIVIIRWWVGRFAAGLDDVRAALDYGEG